MKFKTIILGAILLATNIFAQPFIEKSPKNVRFIAGGYVDRTPYYSTVTAALNNVKAYATADNPYTFWIVSDTTFISDWVAMRDSIEDYYILSGKIRWAGFGWMGVTVVDRTQNPYSTPEEYMPYDVGDNTTSVRMAVDSSRGRTTLFRYGYNISDSIKITNFEKKHIVFTDDSYIASTVQLPTANSLPAYYTPTAELIFDTGEELVIEGGRYIVNPSATSTYHNGIVTRDVKKIKVTKLDITGAKYSNFRVVNAEDVQFEDCIMDSADYANLLISASNKTIVRGGKYSYAGKDRTDTNEGYGLSFTGGWRYPYASGTQRENKDITIENVTAEYNARDGADTHGGLSSTVKGCFIRGFGYAGISGTNEDGEVGFGKRLYNRTIFGNTIYQDSLWLAERNFTGLGTSTFWTAILAGDYQNSVYDTLFKSSGSWQIAYNILDSLQGVGSRAPIFFFASTTKPRPQIENVDISFNKINFASVTSVEFDGEQDGIIHIGAGVIPPKTLHMFGNTISGTGTNGIKILATNPWTGIDTGYTNYAKIIGNTISGDIKYPLFVSTNNIHQFTIGNTYNDKELPNVTNGYNGTSTGILKSQTTGDSTAITDTINANGAADGIMKFEINISATSDDVDQLADYRFIAVAKNTASTPSFTINYVDGEGYEGTDPALYQPTLVWRTNGNLGILKLIGANNYTGYLYTIKFSSRSLPIWRTE